MASTQTLTELPVIQETGMDYTSVISQIKEIIENNNNWSQNWTEFYNSEAGTLLIQLMAWICDNLAVRQDLIYNENYLATASSDDAKRRLLHQIGYSLRSKKATVVKVALEFNSITENTIPLSNCRTKMDDFSSVKSNIFKFYGKDINGKSIPFEILRVNSDGVPDYIYSVYLKSGNNYYTKDKEGNELIAIQGNTVYKEFTSDTNDGPIFELEQDLDIDSIKVYDISNQNLMHVRVDNFTDLRVFNGNIPCYVVEQNENGNYQIRYPSRNLIGGDGDAGGLFNAGNTICAFYRTCDGSDANIPVDYMYVSETVEDETGESLNFTITNISSGYYGKDAEELDNAVKDAPLSLVTANRAVTSEDFDRILKRNSLVLKTKTFTPENMPTAFEKYFGRKIMPQEAFSMLILNKQINSIPDNKLNYFPWSETIKSSVLNEKYLFGDVELNRRIAYDSNKYNNFYIKDKKAIYNNSPDTDNGQNYNDSYNYNNKQYARMLKNALIFSTSSSFYDTISSEIINDTSVMKVKVHSAEEDVLYIDDITNIIGTKENLTTKGNVLVKDTNASYTASRAGKVIDCKKYKYLKFVLDDTHVITVDLHKELYNENTIKNINAIAEKTSGIANQFNKNNAIEFFDNYYLYLTNDEPKSENKKWLELAKDFGVVIGEDGRLDSIKAKPDAWKSMKVYYNSVEGAELRKGIIELIKETLEEVLNYNSEIDYEAMKEFVTTGKTENSKLIYGVAKKFYDDKSQGQNGEYKDIEKNFNKFLGDFCEEIFKMDVNNNQSNYPSYQIEKINDINNFTKIYKITNNENSEYYVVQLKTAVDESSGSTDEKITLAKILNTSENESKNFYENTDIDDLSKQDVMYNNCFADKSIFIDLGIQQEFTIQRDSDKEDVYLEQQKGDKKYYRIRIGEDIYAIRMDEEAFNKMVSFYESFEHGENGPYYDYFPYIGMGDLYYGVIRNTILNIADEKATAFLNTLINKPFSRKKIADSIAGFNRDEMIGINGMNTIRFDLTTIARILEYAFSPLNIDTGIIYKFNSESKAWEDLVEIKLNRNNAGQNPNRYIGEGYVMNGCLRVREVKKSNYPENSVLDLYKVKNLYSSGYEKDLRFELIDLGELGGEESENLEEKLKDGKFIVSSVSVQEISHSTNSMEEDAKINNETSTEDLIECLLGNRRSYSSERSNYVNNIDQVVSYIGEKDYAKLMIKSLKKGKQGSIYFVKTTKNQKESELIYYLGLVDNFVYDYDIQNNDNKFYGNFARSRKAYGQRRVEMILGDVENNNGSISFDNTSFTVSNGVNVNDIKDVAKPEELPPIEENNIISVTMGDIIGTSSDINYTDFANVYVSYLLNDINRLQIDKQNNFYYTDNTVLNEKAKPPIIGIEGESVYFDSDNECYKIDETKSDFMVKLTVDKVDTNSFYNINEDTFTELQILPQKKTKIETNVINGAEAYRGKPEKPHYQVPLIISIDKLTNDIDGTTSFIYNNYKDSVIAINPGNIDETTGSYIYDQFNNRIKSHTNEYLKNNCYAFVNKYYNTNDKLIISSVVSNKDTNLTFYYPDDSAFGSQLDDLNITNPPNPDKRMDAVDELYKLLFGTSLTNKEFYDLYPKDDMLKINGLSSENESQIVRTISDTEYFYRPSSEHSLKFVYRTFIDSTKKKSKFGDYYITCENNGNSGFNDGYRFFINKTEGSKFPDKGFYLHFINDRTYEPNRSTEEDVLIEYMKKHQIIGTEFHVLKPYFKTFDIKGIVKYNANYSVSDIRPKVENALKEKYRISSVKDLEIGNIVYRSDIFKTVLGLEGVEGFELEYFGYDYTNKDKYPDQKYSLNILDNGESKIGPEFYIMSILATSSGKHGIMLEYEPKQETI